MLPTPRSSPAPASGAWLRVLSVVMATALLLPGSAFALSVSGCSLRIVATDAAGATIGRVEAGADTVVALGPAETMTGTRSDPLPLDWDGRVEWEAGLDGEPADLRARLSVFGIPVFSGRADARGALTLGDAIPFRVVGLLHVTAELDQQGQTCTAGGWVRLAGNPVGTLPFLVALLLAGLGLVLCAAALRGAWAAGPTGGLLLGAGSALLAISLGVLPLDEATPIAALGASLLTGIGAAVYGRSADRRRAG